MDNNSLADRVLEGDVRATARLIRLIDDGDRAARPELAKLYKHAGRAHIVGFTGSPGVGKSTLVDKITTKFREHGQKVGILAVDPTSPFSGGAILGDRIRMQKHFVDEGVFIRSMATRGKFGGLTGSTSDAAVVLDAMGKDIIILETVGVGQDEVDVAHSAHTTVLVTIPGMGDDIQAIKAGLMEIGDLFVVNKADREGTAKTVRELKFMIHMSSERYQASGWVPPVMETMALEERGIDELYTAIMDHRAHLMNNAPDEWRSRERRRLRNQVLDQLRDGVMERIIEKIGGFEALDDLIDQIIDKKKDPYGVNMELLQNIFGGNSL
jgi:LAO/AO transport system kinase